jgi:carboxyl-terminal processing protease
MARAIHGEFQQSDSIKYADTVRYSTLGGRTVRGGGGIMPDYFIPADTSGFSKYYSKVTQKGLVYQFALNYADANREKLSDLHNITEFEKYFKNKDVLSEFVNYASGKGVPVDNKDLKTSSEIIDNQLKAYIARNIMGEEGFYPIIKNIDKVLLEAIEKSKVPINQKLTGAVTK